jgi:leucyl/phenylalanyl-tRNA---protein transferase
MRRAPYVVDTSRVPRFPDNLRPDRDGLVAVGGDLSEPQRREAYAKGIFPWLDDPVPAWFSPDPRMVLYPEGHRLPERLARTMRQGRHTVRFDTDFALVIEACASTERPDQDGTWISPAFREAYTALHRSGFAHCVAVHRGERVVGGLYGVSLGRAFFGESMFSAETDASKIAVAHLVAWCRAKGLAFVDCQVPTPHLASLGAVAIPRARFLAELADALGSPTLRYPWTEEAGRLVVGTRPTEPIPPPR